MSERPVAVVIPCFREREHILEVIAAVPDVVQRIYCVDDACPDGTGDLIERDAADARVRVLRHTENRGVGGAMVTGYAAALADGCEVVVKVDGDGQMDPGLIDAFTRPILGGHADYTKGNRFHRPEDVAEMPAARLIGNALFSFMSKLSTGYWQVFDPNNGYTAIHADVLRLIPLGRVSSGYFFESDMLFRLNTLRAVVLDIPMPARYREETSHIRVHRELPRFVLGHLRNLAKRIGYNYFLRDFHVASLEWVLGPMLALFGTVFGAVQWTVHVQDGTTASAGTVMLAALPLIIGIQLTLSALQFDMANRPTVPLHLLLARRR